MPANSGNCEEVAERKTKNHQATPKPFPFLRLPSEIRNEIYRLVLLRENVSTEIYKVGGGSKTQGEDADDIVSAQSGEVAVGTIRCRCWRTYTIQFQVSILRANRQIYHEACSIFNLENFWTIVRVNKTGFGKQMKDRGFPIATADDLWRGFRFPVMRVTVIFPTLVDQRQSDAFLIATDHLKQLMRVLWTAKGSSEIEVMIHVQPPLTNKSPSERHLLHPFLRLRSIKKITILGVSKRRYISQLTSKLTTRDGLTQTYADLMASTHCMQKFIEAQQWNQAIVRAEKHGVLLIDSKIVYGNRFIGVEPDLNVNTSIARSHVAKEILVATALGIAEITLHLRQYNDAIRVANRALTLLSRVSFFNPALAAIPTTPLNHPLLIITGTVTSVNNSKCYFHCIRARASMGMQNAENAMVDIEKARELMPTSVTLASVSEDWQARFGSVTSCAPPLPPAAATFVDAVDESDI
ncbi:hypothetical protein MMC29_000759 [Sticta canariensis]|nr:hypothetical protein [Sticta canariensis]